MREDERTMEQVYNSAVKGLYARIRSYYDYLYKKYGDEGLEMISDMSREYGLTIAERARKAVKNNDIEGVASYLMRIFKTVAWNTDKINLVTESPDEIIIKVDDCPLHFTDTRMCLAHTTMEKTVVEGLNPELTYVIRKSIPAGDAFCEHIVCKK
ncbi:MAG: hypothetical protein JW712_05445 [Dehalococcoidales bacterium]|nr:hypothetical protein [Dehalococcoidales bacterium]